MFSLPNTLFLDIKNRTQNIILLSKKYFLRAYPNFRMDTIIYETRALILPSELNASLQRLANKIDINWDLHVPIELSQKVTQDLNYLCCKLEAYVVYLQLESNFERLQNSMQRETLHKINAVLSVYNNQIEDLKEHQARKSKKNHIFKWFKKYRKSTK